MSKKKLFDRKRYFDTNLKCLQHIIKETQIREFIIFTLQSYIIFQKLKLFFTILRNLSGYKFSEKSCKKLVKISQKILKGRKTQATIFFKL